MIRFADFAPDRASFDPDASDAIINAIPVSGGWGPQPDLVAISAALGEECNAAIAVKTSAGAWRHIAGTATGFYELNLTDYTWTDISGPSAPYGVPVGEAWGLNVNGPNLVATNITDDPQYLDIDSGLAFADVPGSPPKARYNWNSGEFLVLGNIAGSPNRIMTSGIGDIGFWTVGERGCDFQEFPDGGEVQGGIGSERGAIIAQRTMIRQMALPLGVSDFSYSTQIVNPNRGIAAPYSLCQYGPGQFFYYSSDGFMLGAEGKPIGAEMVDKWFASRIDPQKIGSIRSVVDPYTKIIWTQAEEPSGAKFLIGYNWLLGRWCQSDAMLSTMCVMVTPGVSIDGLDDLYASIDDISEPFDSGLFTGGLPRFAAFNTSNELGFFTGSARAAVVETSDDEPFPGSRAFVGELRFYTDAQSFTAQVGTRDYHGGDITWSDEVTPYSTTKTCHFRKSGRLFRYRQNIPEGQNWNHSVGVLPKSRQEGQR